MEGLYTGPPFRTRTRKHPDKRPSDNRTRNQGDVTLLISGHNIQNFLLSNPSVRHSSL